MRKIVERQTCDIGGEVVYSDESKVVDGKNVGITAKQVIVDGKAYLLDVCPTCMPKYLSLTVQQVMERGVQVPWKKNKVVVQTTKVTPKTKKTKPDGKGEKHEGKLPPPPITLGSDGKHHCPGCSKKFGTRRGLQKHWTQRINANLQEVA